MKKNKYSASELIEDLRREIFKIIPTTRSLMVLE